MSSAAEYQRAWKQKNADKVKAYNKSYYMRYRDRERAKSRRRAAKRRARDYGVTVDLIDQLQAAQGNRCLICKRSDTKLVVDHCHKSGMVRALLCHGCNNILGSLEKAISRGMLLRYLAYLALFEEKR